jgi:hypothetical protein
VQEQQDEAENTMISKQQKNIIKYIVICISDFAGRFNIDAKAAHGFLAQYGGIAFLIEHYDIEHTLSIEDALDDLELVCRQNGGILP